MQLCCPSCCSLAVARFHIVFLTLSLLKGTDPRICNAVGPQPVGRPPSTPTHCNRFAFNNIRLAQNPAPTH